MAGKLPSNFDSPAMQIIGWRISKEMNQCGQHLGLSCLS